LDNQDTGFWLLGGIFAFFQENYLIRMSKKFLVKGVVGMNKNSQLTQGGRYGRSGNN
jgi:hypothetical protein